MLYTYTPEDVGGRIIYEVPTGRYSSQDLYFDGQLVSIKERQNDGLLIIRVYSGTKTIKVISNVELDFLQHPTDNYYYPVEKLNVDIK